MLNLSNCHIQDYGICILRHNLHLNAHLNISHLFIDNNDISSSSDDSISDIIISGKVKLLNISYNNSVGETSHFFTILTNSSSVIEQLVMCSNNYSTIDWAEELFSSLGENKTLKALSIWGNNISDDVCSVICEALRDNSTLRELHMYDNPLSGQASQRILDALKENNTLEELSLPSYPVGITKEITSLKLVVNEKRRRRGCYVKLEIS